MRKQIPVREAAARFLVGILAAAAMFVSGCGGSKDGDSFRSVQIYELEGTAQIERQESGVVNAVENLYLEALDRVTVAAESIMRLKLDDDKYVLAEENTIFSIRAEGSKEDSQTTIELEQGGITNEIQNPLSKDSWYEVETPNSVMAVRGTVFRVEVTYDKNGETYVKVTTFEGTVSSKLRFADGTYGDEVMIEDGKEVIIYSDSRKTEYLGEPEDTDYGELSQEALSWLGEWIEQGGEAKGITKEGLDALLSGDKKAREETSGKDRESQISRQGKKSGAANAGKKTGGNTGGKKDVGLGKSGSAQTYGNTRITGDGKDVVSGGGTGSLPDGKDVVSGGGTGSFPDGKGVVSDGGTGSAQDGTGTESGGTESAGDGTGSGGGTESAGDGKGSGESGGTGSSGESGTVCTVTFMYQGKVFATQTVGYGQTAAAPKLSPSAQGKWDFDFAGAVRENITINWKE